MPCREAVQHVPTAQLGREAPPVGLLFYRLRSNAILMWGSDGGYDPSARKDDIMIRSIPKTWLTVAIGAMAVFVGRLHAQRQMEALDRGVVAVYQGAGRVYVGWRMLGTDPNDVAFNVYRDGVRLNPEPIARSTNLLDPHGALTAAYTVCAVVGGVEGLPSDAAGVWTQPYLTVPLQTPEGYAPNDASVADLDGDGQYEIVVHMTGRGHDNAHSGVTDEPILDAYELDGALVWRIHLGINIREGAHYTQFMVYDLDGDGIAELACKTADGTTDGQGDVLGDPAADHRNSSGYVLSGPEFLTLFDGRTGAALITTDYVPPRGKVSSWGDSYGNRVDRFLACIAYLDGQRPSLVMCRGYYTRAVLVAWDWRGGRLTHRWTFDSDDGTPGNRAYRGQGNHNLSVGDVDGDGRDEVVYGACAIDDDGTGLYATGLGHGDAMHLSDIDPDRGGLEVWGIHENPSHPYGANLRDGATGAVIWGAQADDVGRGVCMDLDPRHRGYECWASGVSGLYNCKGQGICSAKPKSCNFGVWWDGDLLREILDSNKIAKWQWDQGKEVTLVTAGGCSANNGTKSTPCLCADILGDWREEVVWRTIDNRSLRIHTTTLPTEHRLYTLMHDPQYRLSIAWQNVAYNQPPHPGFFIGQDMKPAPRAKIIMPGAD